MQTPSARGSGRLRTCSQNDHCRLQRAKKAERQSDNRMKSDKRRKSDSEHLPKLNEHVEARRVGAAHSERLFVVRLALIRIILSNLFRAAYKLRVNESERQQGQARANAAFCLEDCVVFTVVDAQRSAQKRAQRSAGKWTCTVVCNNVLETTIDRLNACTKKKMNRKEKVPTNTVLSSARGACTA